LEKKIAIAIFGIPRGAEKTHHSLIDFVVEQAKQIGDVKLFGHLFKINEVINSRSGENGVISNIDYNLFADFNPVIENSNECLSQYNLKLIKQYGDMYNDNFKSFENLIHQLHSLKNVTNQIEEYKPDAVIFVRPDLLYHKKFPKHVLSLATRNPWHCYIPSWQWWGGYNDRFAVCGKEAYRLYGRRVELIHEFCESTRRLLHSERFLRYVIKSKFMKMRLIDVTASRVRVNGQVKAENFGVVETIGSRRLLIDMTISHFLTTVRL
jgi:hypothetical protein